jgi:hypothetical protein
MKPRGYLTKFVMVVTWLLLMSCLLPGMIPLNREPAAPMPVMEKDADKVIEALNGKNYVRLEAWLRKNILRIWLNQALGHSL